MKAQKMWTDKYLTYLSKTAVRMPTEYGVLLVNKRVLVQPLDAESVMELRALLDSAIGNSGDWSFGSKPTIDEITTAVITALRITAKR